MGCVDSKSGIETEEHKCNILTKMDTIRPCNTQQCATWQTSMWSQVSCIYLHLFSKDCSQTLNVCYILQIVLSASDLNFPVFRYLWGSRPGSWGGLFRELGLWPGPETPHPTALPPPEMFGVETRPMEYGIDFIRLCPRDILVHVQYSLASMVYFADLM